MHLLSFAEPSTSIIVTFPVDVLIIPGNGDACKPRDTSPVYVAGMVESLGEEVAKGSTDLVQGPIICTILSTSTESTVSKEEVIGELQAWDKVVKVALAAEQDLIPLHDEANHELNQRAKKLIEKFGEVVVIGCTHLTTAVQQIYSKHAAGDESCKTVARRIRFVNVKVYIHLTAKEAFSVGTAHNSKQHNVRPITTHDKFRGISKHYRSSRAEGMARQGSGSRDASDKLAIMRCVRGNSSLTKKEADCDNYIWKACTWCESVEYHEEMSTIMQTLDAENKSKALSKSFFEALILNMDTSEGVDFIIAVLKEVRHFM